MKPTSRSIGEKVWNGIRNGLVISSGLVAIITFIAGIILNAWHLYFIAICAIVMFKQLFNPKEI